MTNSTIRNKVFSGGVVNVFNAMGRYWSLKVVEKVGLKGTIWENDFPDDAGFRVTINPVNGDYKYLFWEDYGVAWTLEGDEVPDDLEECLQKYQAHMFR